MQISEDSQFDAIVVGTGPGGATVAREMSLRKKRVLMLEMGPNPEAKGKAMQALRATRMEITDSKMPIVRQITTGGSTFSYCATAIEPNHVLFMSHGVDISAEAEEAKNDLPFAALSDDLVGPMARRLMESAQALGYDWQKLPKFIYQDKCKPACWRCLYRCPYGAKWDARMFVDEAVRNGGTLINNATVEKVVTANNKATGVVYTQKGRRVTVSAPTIVISAGGMGTPTILRETGIKEAGYDFFIDPLTVVMGTVSDLKGGLAEIPMAAGIDFEDEGCLMTDIVLTRPIHMAMAASKLNLFSLFAGKRTLPVMIKIRDELGGGLPTGKGRIHKSLSENDTKVLQHGYERARQILERAGAKHVMMCDAAGAHPGGTAKIGEVVDSNLQTEYENLYVCDTSVYPGTCGIPPVLTLVALGKRLVKHLTGEGNRSNSEYSVADTVVSEQPDVPGSIRGS